MSGLLASAALLLTFFYGLNDLTDADGDFKFRKDLLELIRRQHVVQEAESRSKDDVDKRLKLLPDGSDHDYGLMSFGKRAEYEDYGHIKLI